MTVPSTPRAPRWGLASLSLAMLLSSLGTSIANVGLPSFAEAFGVSFQAVQWVVLAYLLAITTLIVSVGRLGDLFGRKRLLLGGIGLFTIASAACAVAPSLWVLIAARAAQGLGAAVMMALSTAFVSEAVPKARLGSAMGLLGTMSALGTALGPSLGGVLIATFGWPALFAVNVPLGALAVVLAAWGLPDGKPERRVQQSFDLVGTAVLALTLGAYALAMTLGKGQFGLLNLGLLLVALLGTVAFLVVERRAASPLIDLAMFADGGLRSGLATSGLVATVMMTTLVVGPFYLSRALGLEPALVGAVMSIGPIVSAVSGVFAGRLVDRLGASRTAVAGLAGMVIGAGALVALPALLGVGGYIVGIAVLTPGYQLFQAANTTQVMRDVAPERRGVTSGLLSLSRNLGLITGASLMGAIFALATLSDDVTKAAPAAVGSGMAITFAVAALLLAVAAWIAVAGAAAGRPKAASAP
ncbi:MFS transporter [Devosia sp.]|uniref:MFS transporter n=1 Tax=Devosia sp. TaxID=1871048 RepID=UPI003BACEC78